MTSRGASRGRLRLVDSWSTRGPLRVALAPLSWAYRLAIACRRVAFGVGLMKARAAEVPVVSIGNLTVGGTGKTPATLWLAERLREDGFSPAIVSRGYSGRLAARCEVVGRGGVPLFDVDEIGDEAALLAARFEGVVVCGAERSAAVQIAVEQEGADVVVLDDGFQHWHLQRNLDLVLVDGRHGFGNGSLLPAGPMRESLHALKRADAIVVTKEEAGENLRRTLGRYAADVPVFSGRLRPAGLSLWEEGRIRPAPLGELIGRKVVVVCGIAEPRSFYELLGQLETQSVEVLEYGDHHRFSQSDWHEITQAAHRADLVVCTEKDLVKLSSYPFARGRLGALRVDFELTNDDGSRLYELVRGRLRSGAGRATGPYEESDL